MEIIIKNKTNDTRYDDVGLWARNIDTYHSMVYNRWELGRHICDQFEEKESLHSSQLCFYVLILELGMTWQSSRLTSTNRMKRPPIQSMVKIVGGFGSAHNKTTCLRAHSTLDQIFERPSNIIQLLSCGLREYLGSSLGHFEMCVCEYHRNLVAFSSSQ